LVGCFLLPCVGYLLFDSTAIGTRPLCGDEKVCVCLFVAEINSELLLKDILAFWTGADRVPPCGFDSDLKIDFYSVSDGERRLPSASTCSLTLNLPRDVGDPDILWLLLIDAVKMSAGFGKM